VATTVPQTLSIALGASLITVLDHRVLLAVEATVLLLSAALVARIRSGTGAGLTERGPRCPSSSGPVPSVAPGLHRTG
jgi:hypothetical protein